MDYFALNFIPGSIYQMFSGASIVTTLLFTRLLIRNKLKLFKIVGAIIAFIGVLIVGASTLVTENITFAYGFVH